MSNLASENSSWLKSYAERVNKARGKSNGNKWIIPVIMTIIMGGLIGLMIANGGLDDPERLSTIKLLGVIAGVMLLLSVILIAKGKKKKASLRTEDNLNELLTSKEEVAAFDAQMSSEPVFKVENSSNDCYFATKDYFGRKFSDMGDETYEFIHIRDIASIHYRGMKGSGIGRSYFMDLRDASGNVLMNGMVANRSRLDSLKEDLSKVISDTRFVEEGSGE